MIVTESFDLQLSDLLNRVGIKLQITPTQHELAELRYLEIGKWLSAPGNPLAQYAPQIYPQGSLRIGTTALPPGRRKYDLDFVLGMDWDWKHVSNPVLLLDRLEARLREHGTYSAMVERKNRCIRIQYANQFHLDIVPACPDILSGGTCVVVPDRAAHAWIPSNPKGYADWFEGRSKVSVFEMAEKIEPLPDWEPHQSKSPLCRTVQLLKRWRDIRYARTPDLAPISIVLTTLAGHYYGGEELVDQALERIVDHIVAALPSVGRLIVLNPRNPKEDLSERWKNLAMYQAFVSGIRELQTTLAQLRREHNMTKVQIVLQNLFGEELAKTVLMEQAKAIDTFRTGKRLGVTRGSGTLAGISVLSVPVKKNTFYGGKT